MNICRLVPESVILVPFYTLSCSLHVTVCVTHMQDWGSKKCVVYDYFFQRVNTAHLSR